MTSNHNKQEPYEFDKELSDALFNQYQLGREHQRLADTGKKRKVGGEITDAKKAIEAAIAERDKLIDRIELIDETGRVYVKGPIYGTPVSVRLSYQDDGRTLKVFVEPKALTGTNPSQGAAQTIITEQPTDVDHAIRLLAGYLKGENSFDELDFKKYIIEKYIPEYIGTVRRKKNGWNANGTIS